MHGILESGAGRTAERIFAVSLGIAAGVGAVMVVGIHLATGRFAAADRAYWTVSGRPCRQASAAEIHRIGRPLAQVVDFGEGRFDRISGAVECTDVTNGWGAVQDTVCQFNRPRAVGVFSEGGDRFYDTGAEPATVTASRNRPPLCVLAAHYRGD